VGIGHYLFGFSGRINRAKIWLFLLIVIIYFAILVATVFSVVGLDTLQAVAKHQATSAAIGARLATAGIAVALLGLGDLVLIFCGFAVATKRLHDRNKSAWWLLVFFMLPFALNMVRFASMMAALQAHGPLPVDPVGTLAGGAALLINLWAFVELYCLRGTIGDNRFGPDPLA